jgi:hypothetical protein
VSVPGGGWGVSRRNDWLMALALVEAQLRDDPVAHDYVLAAGDGRAMARALAGLAGMLAEHHAAANGLSVETYLMALRAEYLASDELGDDD